MKLYVLIYEPYHENSEVHGVFDDFALAWRALGDAPATKPEPVWDCSDTWDLQEWDTETRTKTRHWVNSNPNEPVTPPWPKGKVPVKLGWRITEVSS